MAINTVTSTFKLMFTLNLLLVGFCKKYSGLSPQLLSETHRNWKYDCCLKFHLMTYCSVIVFN